MPDAVLVVSYSRLEKHAHSFSLGWAECDVMLWINDDAKDVRVK